MTTPDHTEHVRWGVLGTGGIATAFVEDVAGSADAQVVAVGSRRAETAAGFARRLGVPRAHAGYEELLADPEVDAVYVATPHPMHAGNALTAIAAGKAVLVEKPFTVNAAAARRVVEAARAAGVFCMEAMWTRFLPHVVRIRELLAQGAVGQVRTLVADHGQRFAPDPRHRLFAPDLGGGALLDLGVYPFSFASMVLGAPDSVTATSDPTPTGVDATTSAVLRYPGGAHAVLTCTMTSFTPRRAWISGTAGRIDVDPVWYAPTSFTLTCDDGSTERFDTPAGVGAGAGKGLRFEVAEVGRCLRAGLVESPVMPLDESVTIMETIDQVRAQIGLTYPPPPPDP